MANQHTMAMTYKTEGGTVTVSSQIIEDGSSTNLELEVPDGVTDYEVNVSVPVATLRGFCVALKKKIGQAPDAIAGPLTIKTNSIATPGDTLTISSTNGIGWMDGNDENVNPIPLTADVTKLFITNEGDAIADFTLRALNDPTP